MKGYSPRERNGMIVLACLVLLCFCIEPLAGVAGCSRGGNVTYASADYADSVIMSSAGDGMIGADPQGGDITEHGGIRKNIRKEERSDSHRKSDSIRDARRKNRTDSARRAKKRRSGGKEKHNDAPVKRRSLRDEPL